MIRKSMAGLVCVLASASIATAATAVNVDIATPNARVQVGNTPAPPPPSVVVVEKKETVVVKEHKDNGKHKGHKKHKKHKDEHKHHD